MVTSVAKLAPKTIHNVFEEFERPEIGDLQILTNRSNLVSWAQAYLIANVIDVQAVNTAQAKIRDLRLFMTFFESVNGHLLIDQWLPRDTRAFLNHLAELGRAPTTINRAFATLRHFARWAHSQPKTPFARVGLPTAAIKELSVEEPEAKKLEQREVFRLLKAADLLVLTQRRRNSRPKRNRAIFVVLLYTGLRVTEIINLKLSQWDGKRFVDVRRKGNVRSRSVYLKKSARALLQEYLESERAIDAARCSDHVFLSASHAGGLKRAQVNEVLHRIAEEATKHGGDIHLHPHRLRHTFAFNVREINGSDSETARLLGHQSDKYAGRYARHTEAEREAVLEQLGCE